MIGAVRSQRDVQKVGRLRRRMLRPYCGGGVRRLCNLHGIGARVLAAEMGWCRLPTRQRSMTQLIIYDFDGVIADSEVLANAVLAQFVTELGVHTTLEGFYRLYMG